jgi:hypothetical protein
MEILFIWIIMAFICGMVASSKNRSFFMYFLGGLLLWPIVLVAAILAKPLTGQEPSMFDAMRDEPAPQPAQIQGTAFEAHGMIGPNPYRRDGEAVIVLIGGAQVRFESYDTARREITGSA